MNPKPAYNYLLLSLVTLTATLGGFLFGFDTAVISGTIGLVGGQFGLGPLMEGWVVSSALLGCIGGVVLSGRLSSTLGRKKVMLLAALLFIASAIGCALCPTSFWLVAFRLLGGLGIGIASVICPMYISELAPAAIRGRLVTYYQLAITLGILAAYFSNTLIQRSALQGTAGTGLMQLLFVREIWRGMFIVGALPAFIFIILITLIPESPRWLVLKGRAQKAAAVLTALGGAEQASREMDSLQAGGMAAKAPLKELFRGKLRLPLLLAISLAALSQFSGINAIIYYGPAILEKAGFKLSEALGGQVTIGLVNMAFTFVAILVIDRMGRRPLLIWGVGGAFVALLGCGILFTLGITNGMAILVSILLFIACFAFSFGPVVWVIISEIFPTRVRSEAVAVSTLGIWIANWLVGQFFPLLNQWPALPFFVFAGCCLLALWLCIKKIPETRGRTLEEIEKFW